MRAANAAAEHLLGYSRLALIDMCLDDLCDPAETPRLDAAFDALAVVGAARGDWRIRQNDGQIVPVDVVATRCMVDGQAMVQILARDLSDPARLESARSLAATASGRLVASQGMRRPCERRLVAVPGLADSCTLDVFDKAGPLVSGGDRHARSDNWQPPNHRDRLRRRRPAPSRRWGE